MAVAYGTQPGMTNSQEMTRAQAISRRRRQQEMAMMQRGVHPDHVAELMQMQTNANQDSQNQFNLNAQTGQQQADRDRLLNSFQEGHDARQAGFQNDRDYRLAVYHAMHAYDQAGYQAAHTEQQGQIQSGLADQHAFYQHQQQQNQNAFTTQHTEQQGQIAQQQTLLHGGVQAVLAAQHTDLQGQLNQTMLTQAETAHMQRLNNGVAQVRMALQNGEITQDVANMAIQRIRTGGLDEYQQRDAQARGIHQQLQQEGMEHANRHAAMINQANEHFDASTAQDRLNSINLPDGRTINAIRDRNGNYNILPDNSEARADRQAQQEALRLQREAEDARHRRELEARIETQHRTAMEHEAGDPLRPRQPWHTDPTLHQSEVDRRVNATLTGIDNRERARRGGGATGSGAGILGGLLGQGGGQPSTTPTPTPSQPSPEMSAFERAMQSIRGPATAAGAAEAERARLHQAEVQRQGATPTHVTAEHVRQMWSGLQRARSASTMGSRLGNDSQLATLHNILGPAALNRRGLTRAELDAYQRAHASYAEGEPENNRWAHNFAVPPNTRDVGAEHGERMRRENETWGAAVSPGQQAEMQRENEEYLRRHLEELRQGR